jgi:ABC-type multidrug transport system permease subunit
MDIPWREIWQDILDVLLYIPRRVFELLMSALAELLNSIPLPAALESLATLFSGIPAGVSWGFYILNLATGIALVAGAYVIRFLIRRIPIIG